MTKIIAIAAMCLFVGGVANAQIKLGIDLGLQVPMGDFEKMAEVGLGGNVNGEYAITENIGAGLSIGYYKFSFKDNGFGEDESFTVTPVALNGKYYFMTEGLKPYAGLDLGMYFLSSTFENSEVKGKFGLAPVVGLQYDFSDNMAINANVKYNYIMAGEKEELGADALTSFGINVGVVYTLGN
ncbi:MAG: porin family protein [Prevotellaceae bacterium]|nr:porin family protein [Prevotellaceae bacterium]